jgi:predicted TIM-barrel fold metal-dependent hydrolase
MHIVDAQVHLNQLVDDWRDADPDTVIATAITTMDALGIERVLIAESRGFDAQMRPALGHVLPNGAVRAEYPFSERAVARHPDRFGYLCRIDVDDPELDRLMSQVRTKPGALCVRIVPIPNIGEVDRLARGEFEPLFAAAETHGVPVFAGLSARGQLLEPYLVKFPRVQVILDHCGVGVEPPRLGTIAPTLAPSMVPTLAERVTQLNQVAALARYPNLSLKWCHAPARFSAEGYPFRDVIPHLRTMLDAFGMERVMWASDYTQSRDTFGGVWAEALYYLRDSDQLSDVEKEWLLGGSVRRVLRWD